MEISYYPGKTIQMHYIVVFVIKASPLKVRRIKRKSNNKYYYKISVQNKAGLWSADSEVSEINALGTPEFISQIFNAPNPFNSNIEETTVYYSLANPKLATVCSQIRSILLKGMTERGEMAKSLSEK